MGEGMDTAVLQLIASSVFACAGAVIAATAAVVSYRNNFGWPPVALFLKYVWGGDSEFPGYIPIEVRFEFWNRQKYPLALREIKIFLGNVELATDCKEVPVSEDWAVIQKGVLLYTASEQSLEGNKHIAFKVRAPIKAQTSGYDHTVRIHLNYFDPIKNKNRIATATYKFDDEFPASYSVIANVN
jgi:hypothetical protein